MGPNQIVFGAIAGCTAVVTFVSYLVPVVTRLLSGVHIRPGPFNLGRLRTPVYVFTACTLIVSTVRPGVGVWVQVQGRFCDCGCVCVQVFVWVRRVGRVGAHHGRCSVPGFSI